MEFSSSIEKQNRLEWENAEEKAENNVESWITSSKAILLETTCYLSRTTTESCQKSLLPTIGIVLCTKWYNQHEVKSCVIDLEKPQRSTEKHNANEEIKEIKMLYQRIDYCFLYILLSQNNVTSFSSFFITIFCLFKNTFLFGSNYRLSRSCKEMHSTVLCTLRSAFFNVHISQNKNKTRKLTLQHTL